MDHDPAEHDDEIRGIHGSGLAIQTALNLLRNYAAHAGTSPEQAGHVRWCITQAEKDWNALREQRDEARALACELEAELQIRMRLTRSMEGFDAEIPGSGRLFPSPDGAYVARQELLETLGTRPLSVIQSGHERTDTDAPLRAEGPAGA